MGRATERYWDGSTWTARVRAGDGEPEVHDPLDAPAGASASGSTGAATAGFGAPAGASRLGGAATAEVVDPLRGGPPRPGLRAHLHRPRPVLDVGAAVAAAAGVIGVIGAYAVVGMSLSRSTAVIVSIVVLGVGYALALVGPPGGRPAAIVAGLLTPIVVVFALLGDDLRGKSIIVVPALLLLAAWAAMFLLPGLRAAPAFIASGAVALWALLVTLVASSPSYGYPSNTYTYGPDSALPYTEDPLSSFTSIVSDAGALTLVLALVFVVAAAVLDRNGWHVAATPLVGVTVPLAVIGLWLSAATAAGGMGFLVMVVGLVLAVVGALGSRRGSAWIGVTLAVSGLVAVVADLVDEPTGAGVLLLIIAACLIAAAKPITAKLEPTSAA